MLYYDIKPSFIIIALTYSMKVDRFLSYIMHDECILNSDLHFQVDYLWDDLRKEFVELDPYGTGFIGKDEFREVMTELCVHLSDYELGILCQKFDTREDGR